MASSVSRIISHLRNPTFRDEVRRIVVGLGDNVLQRPRPRARRSAPAGPRVLFITDGGIPWMDFLEPVFAPVLHVSLEDIFPLEERLHLEFLYTKGTRLQRDWMSLAATLLIAAFNAYCWYKVHRRGRPGPREEDAAGHGGGDEGPGAGAGAGGPRPRRDVRCRRSGGLIDLVLPEPRRGLQWWRPTQGLLDLPVVLEAGIGGGADGPGGGFGVPGGEIRQPALVNVYANQKLLHEINTQVFEELVLSGAADAEGHLGCLNATPWKSNGSLLKSASHDTKVLDCVKVHIMKARIWIKDQLGEEAFKNSGLDATGDQFGEIWTSVDNKKLEVVDSLPGLTRAEHKKDEAVDRDDEKSGQDDDSNDCRPRKKSRSSGSSSTRCRK